jgi:hypothetical protein
LEFGKISRSLENIKGVVALTMIEKNSTLWEYLAHTLVAGAMPDGLGKRNSTSAVLIGRLKAAYF